jgi:hypothetical protein
VSERVQRDTLSMARVAWMIFAPFEFAVMVLGGVLLYLPWAVFIYLDALRGLFERAVTLIVLRFRVGRISSVTRTAAPLSEAPARGPAGRRHFRSWLN